jgi:hypothetical protein
MLIAARCPVNAGDDMDDTALHVAVILGHRRSIDVLLRAGASMQRLTSSVFTLAGPILRNKRNQIPRDLTRDAEIIATLAAFERLQRGPADVCCRPSGRAHISHAGGCKTLDYSGFFAQFFRRERTLESLYYQEAEGMLCCFRYPVCCYLHPQVDVHEALQKASLSDSH